MFGRALIAATLTGAFCAVFAVGVDAVLPPVMGAEVAIIGLISGFCGSLFAHFVLRKGRDQ